MLGGLSYVYRFAKMRALDAPLTHKETRFIDDFIL